MKLSIKKCTINDDLYSLREVSYNTFNETFKDVNTPEDMNDYLEKAFDINKISEELSNSNSQFYFLYENEELAGYIKINDTEAQTEINDSQALEIERIYVLKEFHSKGLGSILLNKAIEIAKELKKSYIWLGVWEENHKALQFYKRNGFYKIGQHSFFMGDDEQIDFIMKKDI
ncbi:GNAT family N-acetyltransferase [Clostridium sp. SHJSY1]|uniref:GNAT family N-acetyltransferase n=1 Tax=Clostridium sp. SHJSY1 TaxID=2942483 RepID=UPI0028761E82|nr:GNAT family N-acetyltransferase [Clostridium sp. SHJSY1]MDS0524713.1 GNAT family N-acetyltransferase [Clostridium sp. SHJSY1]